MGTFMFINFYKNIFLWSPSYHPNIQTALIWNIEYIYLHLIAECPEI